MSMDWRADSNATAGSGEKAVLPLNYAALCVLETNQDMGNLLQNMTHR